jgi:hypothetical protein
VTTVFLHVAKTGGTAIKRTLRRYSKQHPEIIRLEGHPCRLADVAAPDKAVFAVRDPVERFVSGFNTRLRKGFPRRDGEWRESERWAFERFPTANSLAEALSDPAHAADARRAMAGINHVNTFLKTWLGSAAYVEERAKDILMICWTRELDADFRRLKALLGLPESLVLPTDEVGTHRTPDGFDRRLSERAVENVRAWYADDFPIYEACLALRRRLIEAAAPSSAVA